MNTEKHRSLSRRKFVSSVGMLGAAGLLPVSALATEVEKTTKETKILKVGPYLQAPLPDRITVRWITDAPCYSWVEFGESEDNLDKKVHLTSYGLVEANNTVHAITLKNLAPGREYYYRICSKAIESFEPYKLTYGEIFISNVFTFRTPDSKAEKTEFIVLNDIHDHPESFQQLMQFQGSAKKDFIFLNGDMFDYQTDEDQLINHMLRPVCDIFASETPFIFSRGNHETRGKFARQLVNYFDGGEEKFYYSFQSGPVYVIVLDSGEDKADETPVYAGIVGFDQYRLQQAEWLEREVQKKAFKQAKYKVVLSHIPLYHSGDWHGTMHCRKVWGPILNKANIDLLISGHTHKHGIYLAEEGQHEYPIVIGGGPKVGQRTIIKVKADANFLVLEMLNDSGKLVGSYQI